MMNSNFVRAIILAVSSLKQYLHLHSLPQRWIRFFCWIAIALYLTLIGLPASAQLSHPVISAPVSSDTAKPMTSLAEAGQVAYQSGRYVEAQQYWLKAEQQYQQGGEALNRAIALNRIALTHIKLTEYSLAEQALTQASNLLVSSVTSANQKRILAQTRSTQGELLAAKGQYREAIQMLQSAGKFYEQLDNDKEVIRNQLNQSELMRLSGLYQRAMTQLELVNQRLMNQPDNAVKANALRQLGNLFYQLDGTSKSGLCTDAEDCLQQSYKIAQDISSATEKTLTLISLGHQTSDSDVTFNKAIEFYHRATALKASPTLELQSRINIVRWIVEAFALVQEQTNKPFQAEISQQLDAELKQLPNEIQRIQGLLENTVLLSRSKLRLQASLAESMLELPTQEVSKLSFEIGPFLQAILSQAKQLEDAQFQSYALGYLGKWYEKQSTLASSPGLQTHLREEALLHTQKALGISEQLNLGSMTYQWLWQQGRLLKAELEFVPQQNKKKRGLLQQKAISAYGEAVHQVNLLRGDLITISRQSRVSFRQKIKPIYQDYIELLMDAEREGLAFNPLTAPSNSSSGSLKLSSYLKQAIKTADSLQVSELTNFFRSDCLLANEVNLEEIDQNAAIIYPIVYKDYIEVIIGLPNNASWKKSVAQKANNPKSTDSIWRHQKISFSMSDLEDAIPALRQPVAARASLQIASNSQRYSEVEAANKIRKLGESLYDALIKPFEADLQNSNVDTLIFISSSQLQNVPMAVLRNKETNQYLVEQYAIATSPSLQLLDSTSLSKQRVSAVLGALTESSVPEYGSLKFVGDEAKAIQKMLPGSQLMQGEDFTKKNLERKVSSSSFPVVHLATHGKFGSTLEKTFIVTEDGTLNANELSSLLQGKGLGNDIPIELLVLSACETAKGDDLAALGLSGIAVRSGARSTLGSLWLVDDEGTATLMKRFYKNLTQTGMSRAKALQQAQISLLRDEQLNKQDPYFWAAFVLVGSWL